MRRVSFSLLVMVMVLPAVLGNARAQDAGPMANRVLVLYHYLASKTMNEAYGSAYGVTWQFSPRISGRSSGERFNLQGEVGLTGAVGEPIVTNDYFVVTSSSLEMVAIPLGIAGLYRLSGEESGSFSTYVGIGLLGFLGAERLAVEASNPFWGEFDWHDGVFRASIAGQALFGVRARIAGRVSFAAEISWLQGGKGSMSREAFTEEELAQGWGELAEAVQHPDFSFTGMRLGIGAHW